MNLRLPRYREVKDKYCVCYFGPCNEYITLLLGLRKQAEAVLPGLQLYIGCKDSLYGVERTVPESVIMQMIREPWGTGFGHIREIRCDMVNHPIEQFFKEIKIEPATYKPEPENRVMRFCPNGTSPTQSCTQQEVQTFVTHYTKLGYVVRLDGPWNDAGMVVGVECPEVWEAALAGKSTVLYESGLGTAFFRVICPWGEVISDPKGIHIQEDRA